MAYKFGVDEPVRDAILRCGSEQLDRAVLELSERAGEDPAAAVHSARKAIKKGRSLLRLGRGAMPREQRRRENAALRRAAQGLSGVRDADVMITATDQLSERFVGQLPAQTFEAISTHLEARRSVRRGRENGRAGYGKAVEELVAVRARLSEREHGSGGWEALESGLLRSYRRGREAFVRVRGSNKTDDLHNWRKRVKDLWYHERLLAPVCGPTVRAHAKELGRLADLLGDDHDLALLSHELVQHSPDVPVDLDAVLNLIDHRRAELQTEATHVGQRLYAEKPKALHRRMRRSWKAGRALARAPREQHPAQLAAATRA